MSSIIKKTTSGTDFVNPAAIDLYSSAQVYAIEQAWFEQGYSSFALMQQAAWQIAQHTVNLYNQRSTAYDHDYYDNSKRHGKDFIKGNNNSHSPINQPPRVCVWAGQGNNGGDGWLVAHYLRQAGWQVQVITVGMDTIENNESTKSANNRAGDSDALRAQRIAVEAGCAYQRFEDLSDTATNSQSPQINSIYYADIYIDALFGIGLDRKPEGIYEQAIQVFNLSANDSGAWVIAIDVPSGLIASTGQVFENLAIKADFTWCLVARKFGLHTKDGMDYSGQVLDIPLIPHNLDENDSAKSNDNKAMAKLLAQPHSFCKRAMNSYKGSYGHVLVIGGNRIDGSQGMGGAAILSSSSAMATGAGKITVACHEAFHSALLTSLPDAMTTNLHDSEGVKELIKEASVIAIGMGLGRDRAAQDLFIEYIKAAIAHNKPLVIDADGLYHLARLHSDDHDLVAKLRQHSQKHKVCLTPHSGEAARLLEQEIQAVEADRFSSIKQCQDSYGGDWVLKGAGSLVMEQGQIYVCSKGNAGMASAGMGDVLSGVIAGLLAQQDLKEHQCSLHQAVMVHGLAGDVLVDKTAYHNQRSLCPLPLLVGRRGLQSQDMPAAIRHVIEQLTS